jgi:SAM-dependent methyltransferase
MTFDVAADGYDRFMGRYSSQLSPQLADLAGLQTGQRVLDVGCGPGALTVELVARLGADSVAAVDPSGPFVAAARERYPGVDVQHASAEQLPYPDGAFDATLAQLVVHFMTDPVAGLREMARVTRNGGIVAVSVWDYEGERAPLTPFWRAAVELDDGAVDESGLSGARAGHLAELLEAAGLGTIEETELGAACEFSTFDAWWEPFTFGIGPAGAYAKGLDDARRTELRERCRQLLPEPPFTLQTFAWAARGRVKRAP